jgi:murein DD-endopeptidase MepM/ murein hydrolase activator NlpD
MNRLLITIAVLITLPISARADLTLPVNGVVTSGVGWRVDPFGGGRFVFHRGTDIAVPVGTPVHATRGGRVVFAGVHGGHGNTVIIEHGNGERTLYGHNSSVAVRWGERVEAGVVIAHSGNTGRATGPHVHYELLSDSRREVTAKQAKTVPEPRNVTIGAFRHRQERKMEDIVDAILTKVKNTSTISLSNDQRG